MNLYRVFPEPHLMLSLGEPSTGEALLEWYKPSTPQSVRVSLISTPRGELVGADGTSSSLSNPVDRSVLVAQRKNADAIITGRGTVLAEAVPIAHHAPLVIITRTGDLRGHRVTESSFRHGGVVVLTGLATEADPREFFPEGVARVITLQEVGLLPAQAIIEALRAEGFNHLLVEGGRSLVELFAESGTIDEMCVSLTAAPLSENHPPLAWWKASWGEWSSLHVLTDDIKTLYFRYVKNAP